MVRGWSTTLGRWSATSSAIFTDPLSYSGPDDLSEPRRSLRWGRVVDLTGDRFLASAVDLFGGTLGLQSGFKMTLIPVPEPSSFALAGLGAAAMLIFRRRK